MTLQSDKHSSGMTALRSLTEVLIKELDPRETDRVLDVGTGSGQLAFVLCKLVTKGFVTGIDPARDRLGVAKDSMLRHEVANALLVHGRAETLPFAPQVFDSACLRFSLHHFACTEIAIAEICRVLRAEGHMVSVDPVLKDPVDEEEKRLNELTEEAFRLVHAHQQRFFTGSELQRLYENVGLAVQSCDVYDFPVRQRGTAGIPQGDHWLQAYNLLRLRQEEALIEKFEQNYFSFREEAGQLLVEGKTSWVIIKAGKN